MSPFLVVLLFAALSVKESYSRLYVRDGVLGNDLPISNVLRKNLGVGWNGELKYKFDSEKETNKDSKGHKRQQPGELI